LNSFLTENHIKRKQPGARKSLILNSFLIESHIKKSGQPGAARSKDIIDFEQLFNRKPYKKKTARSKEIIDFDQLFNRKPYKKKARAAGSSQEQDNI
jgi:hypothetical protein